MGYFGWGPQSLFCPLFVADDLGCLGPGLSGLPNANAKSQRFSNAISQIAPLPPVVALNRSFKSQIAARYAAFWHAVPQIALASFLLRLSKSQRFKSQRLQDANATKSQTLAFYKSQRFSATKGPGFRTSGQSSVRPKTVLRRLEKWSSKRRDASHRAPVQGPENPKSVTSRSVTWRRLSVCPSNHGTLTNVGILIAMCKRPEYVDFQNLGEEFPAPEKLGLAPKVLQNLSPTGILLWETFRRTFLQNPKGSAEFWETFGSPDPSFEDQLLSLPKIITFSISE